MKPTFANLIAETARASHATQAQTRQVIESFISTLKEAVWGSGRVYVPELATFRIRAERERQVVDPREPGAPRFTLPASRVVVARVAKSWRRL